MLSRRGLVSAQLQRWWVSAKHRCISRMEVSTCRVSVRSMDCHFLTSSFGSTGFRKGLCQPPCASRSMLPRRALLLRWSVTCPYSVQIRQKLSSCSDCAALPQEDGATAGKPHRKRPLALAAGPYPSVC